MYAIVQSGGHQYRVRPGDTIEVDLLPAAVGEAVTLDEVLLIGDDDTVRVGTPLVSGAQVRATVLGEGQGKKLTVLKYKPKNRYRIKMGHRQRYTRLQIDDIEA